MRLLDYAGWKEEDRERVDDIVTSIVPIVVCEKPVRSIEEALLMQPTILLSAIPRVDKRQGKVRVWNYWPWLVGTVASIVSICATVYYYNAHETLLYADAISHMRIARSAFDSFTPGLAQLGTVWLPLPHVLMWPFVWNDFLWRSGLAGSLVAMPCYVASCILIYLICQRITQQTIASLLGVMFFAFNANILYLQSTPLSELVCIATYLLTVYSFLLWTDNGSIKYLVLVGITAFLATLARYDSWPLALAIIFAIPLCGIVQHKERGHIVAETLLYALLGLLGIILWLMWNKIIFGDAFYFAHGPYSSLVQQISQIHSNHLFGYHDFFVAIKVYAVDSAQSIGIPCTLCALVCLCLTFLGKYRLSHKIALLLLLVLFVFYVYSLYGGNAIIWIPGATPPGTSLYMYNVRYGSQMVAPAAIFFATGIALVKKIPWSGVKGVAWLGIFVLLLSMSITLLIPGGISLQDGQYNTSCAAARSLDGYMYQHYNGGLILDDVSNLEFDTTAAGIDFKNVIYEGSDSYFRYALVHPERYATWVVINPRVPSDLVAQHIHANDPIFAANFTLVAQQSDGGLLFHHNGLSPLPNRPPLPQYTYPHHACLTG